MTVAGVTLTGIVLISTAGGGMVATATGPMSTGRGFSNGGPAGCLTAGSATWPGMGLRIFGTFAPF